MKCSPASEKERCKKFVSTTTRIARGQHRVVKRTATLHPDGKKEVVIEENGVVRRRYVEDCSAIPQPGQEKDADHNEQDDKLGKENSHWYSDIIRGVQGVIQPCFAPCAGPVLATVQEQDV
jgi:hypothetical protein